VAVKIGTLLGGDQGCFPALIIGSDQFRNRLLPQHNFPDNNEGMRVKNAVLHLPVCTITVRCLYDGTLDKLRVALPVLSRTYWSKQVPDYILVQGISFDSSDIQPKYIIDAKAYVNLIGPLIIMRQLMSAPCSSVFINRHVNLKPEAK
jgi:hypothetical protein